MRRYLLLATLLPTLLGAQESTWRVKPDGGNTEPVEWTPMPPGWHITTGPGSIIYDASNVATGRFALSMEVHLFPKASEEGYGVFLGGQSLDGPTATYVAFLMRRDGALQIVRTQGTGSIVLREWSATDAIKPHPGTDGTALNTLTVRADLDSVRVEANGQRITAVPRAGLSLDGTFGFRVGRGINLHVTNLDITRRLAPAPRPRG
jgi:hypothetical protein